MLMFIFLCVLALSVYLVLFVFFPLGRGAIYDPSTPHMTWVMTELAAVRKGEKAADLGSGDGRVIISLAKKGAEAHGYEVNPILVLITRKNIRKAGLEGKAFVHWKSFWSANLAGFDLITAFQVNFIMEKLEAKLLRELSPGSRIVSHHWKFPHLKPAKQTADVYLYKIE
jgi:protein-L-isoaspartate O-methyltransferase